MPSGLELQIKPGPWDTAQELSLPYSIPIEQIPLLVLARRANLVHPAFSDVMLESLERSEWFDIDKGRYLLEIRNPSFETKLHGSADIIDFDDCLFKATKWHKTEYELIATSADLHRRGIYISAEEARELYQQSKIKIPGKVERESRYTPMFNIFLLTQFATLLESGVAREQAWEQVLNERNTLIDNIGKTSEIYLNAFEQDPDIVNIFATNSPRGFVYEHLIPLIFRNPVIASDLKIIATRGKIEGPLGQIYKLHSTGIMDEGVDMVLYSNDLKAEAILMLSRLFLPLQGMSLRAFDDNRSEILPYRQFIMDRGIQNLKLVHVCHKDAKRSEETVLDEKPYVSMVHKESGTRFDHYYPRPDLWLVF